RVSNRRLDQVEGRCSKADERHRRRIEQRKETAQRKAQGLAGPLERISLKPLTVARGICHFGHRQMVDIRSRLSSFAFAARMAKDGVISGVGFHASAAATATLSAVRALNHVTELTSG